MYLRIKILRDPEASVFIATSPDLQGLVIEAETMNELIKEAQATIDMLLGEYLPSANYVAPEIRMKIVTPGRVNASPSSILSLIYARQTALSLTFGEM